MLRKVVYPYEYMDSWKRFEEISLPEKEDFYSNLNMEDITDVDYAYATANNKHMNKYNKYNESSYTMYLDANNLYEWAMSQNLPVDDFK